MSFSLQYRAPGVSTKPKRNKHDRNDSGHMFIKIEPMQIGSKPRTSVCKEISETHSGNGRSSTMARRSSRIGSCNIDCLLLILQKTYIIAKNSSLQHYYNLISKRNFDNGISVSEPTITSYINMMI